MSHDDSQPDRAEPEAARDTTNAAEPYVPPAVEEIDTTFTPAEVAPGGGPLPSGTS